jgi:hypothetical protein
MLLEKRFDLNQITSSSHWTKYPPSSEAANLPQ